MVSRNQENGEQQWLKSSLKNLGEEKKNLKVKRV